MDRKEKIENLMGWLVCIALALIFCIWYLSTTSATISYDNYALKWQLCGALNFSGAVCDAWWGEFADFPNQTTIIVANYTSNANLTNYYTKVEIDILLRGLMNGNISPNSSVQVVGFVTKAEFDNQTLALRNSIMDNYVTNTTLYFELNRLGYSTGDNSPIEFNPWWIVGGLAVLVVGYVVLQSRKGKTVKYDNPIVTIPQTDNDKTKLRMIKQEMEKIENKQANIEREQEKRKLIDKRLNEDRKLNEETTPK